jgi:hypothetical protein
LELDRAVKKKCSSNGARPARPALALAARPARPLKAPKRKRARGILALLAQTKAPARRHVESRAYDVGAPVRASLALAAPDWTPAVEAFELPREAPRAVWPWPVADDESTPATTAFTVEAFEAGPDQPPYAAPSEPESEPVPAPAVEPPHPDTPPPEAIAAALASETDEESAEFARQIQALLSGVVPQPPPAKAPEVPPEPQAPAPPVANAHDVFSRMGRNMSYATEFRLPAMELGKRFDAIENEIESKTRSNAARRARPRATKTKSALSSSPTRRSAKGCACRRRRHRCSHPRSSCPRPHRLS